MNNGLKLKKIEINLIDPILNIYEIIVDDKKYRIDRDSLECQLDLIIRIMIAHGNPNLVEVR